MTALELIKLLLNNISIKSWKFRHVTAEKPTSGPVTTAHIGTTPDHLGFHAAFTFNEGGKQHTLAVVRPFVGGEATITLDGENVPGDVAISKSIKIWPPSIEVELDATLGEKDRYEFRGVVK